MEKLEFFINSKDLFEVKKHKNKDLYLVNVKEGAQVHWDTPFVKDAGGLAMDGDSNVISKTYGKVFEYDELTEMNLNKGNLASLRSITDGTVSEKIDGHLISISQYEGELLFTSKKEFNSGVIHKARQWFHRELTPMEKRTVRSLTKKNTLLFDYVSPEEKVAVKYPKEKLILHGILGTKDNRDIHEKNVLDAIARSIGVETANKFNIDYETMMSVVDKDFGENMVRGFILRSGDGKRISVETDAYKREGGRIV